MFNDKLTIDIANKHIPKKTKNKQNKTSIYIQWKLAKPISEEREKCFI